MFNPIIPMDDFGAGFYPLLLGKFTTAIGSVVSLAACCSSCWEPLLL
ncbi:hypothetical protein MtrunA17_Chr4g0059051 [Medicago truncatula]|uniref:Uncharacterized protein n=1 Tax=Medicago truncatula TaxID=3880 RepID=A0A396ID99_MEDTR|nr:hypothetical protein MtrunA17_Chr4g0059051 [Medicago truncatula]